MDIVLGLIGLVVGLWLLGVVFNVAMFGLGAIFAGIAALFGRR